MSRAKQFFTRGAAELKAVEDAKPKPWEIEPFNGLDTLLILALAEKFHPGTSFNEVMSGKPKRFLNVVFNLATKVQPVVLNATVMPILKSAKPFHELNYLIDTFHMLHSTEKAFIENKCHGLIIHNSIIYPVKVYAEDAEARTWGMDNESTLRTMVAESAMEALELTNITCHVMLFAEWGFSNRLAEVKRVKNRPIKTPTSSVQVIG